MAGTVNISRDLWRDAAFKAEPFTEREAWLWLVMEASYRPREKRIGNICVNLRRGQLAASIRFMADAWGWEKSRAERFVGRLKKRDMIETATETGLSVITLCNYDKYQGETVDSETAKKQKRDSNETAPRQHRDKLESRCNPDAIKQQQQQARTENPIFRGVMCAVGVDPDAPTRYWRGPAAITHILGWQMAHGLTTEEVIEVARLSRLDHPDDVPDGPKALDRSMAAFASAKKAASAPPPKSSARRSRSQAAPASVPVPDKAAKLEAYAEMINGEKHLPNNITPSFARELIGSGLVTAARMKQRGVQT